MRSSYNVYGNYSILIFGANDEYEAVLKTIPNSESEPIPTFLRVKSRFTTSQQALHAAKEYVDRQNLQQQIEETVDHLVGNQVDGQIYRSLRSNLRKLTKAPYEVEPIEFCDESERLQTIGPWKYSIGDAVFISGLDSDGSIWRDDMIVVGRLWADSDAASYFDGHEEMIEAGLNYFCRSLDGQYLSFHHETVLRCATGSGQQKYKGREIR